MQGTGLSLKTAYKLQHLTEDNLSMGKEDVLGSPSQELLAHNHSGIPRATQVYYYITSKIFYM